MTEEKEEGPRSFSVLLQQLADGEAHAEASEALHKLIDKCTTIASQTNGSAKGSLVIKLDVKIDARGIAGVLHDVNVKLPKQKKVAATMWVSKGGNLTPENPKQISLPLREVPLPTPIDFDRETGEVRTV